MYLKTAVAAWIYLGLNVEDGAPTLRSSDGLQSQVAGRGRDKK